MRFFSWLWPAVDTVEGRKSAITGSALVAAWIAFGYLLANVLVYMTGQSMNNGEVDQATLYSIIIANAIFMLLALVLSYRLFRNGGIYSTSLCFIWVLVEAAYKFYLHPGRGFIISLILIVISWNGLRAAWNTRKATSVIA